MTNSERDEALGVYKDQEEAEAAAEQVRRAGVDGSQIRIGDEADSKASLQAEMREEMEEAWLSPQAAFVATKEAAKGLSLVTPVAAVLGVLVTLPLALIFDLGGAPLWVRLLIAVATGVIGGGTVGFVVGGGMAMKGPDEPLAAERGVTVRVPAASGEVVDAMEDEDPIRLDTVAPSGRKTSTVETEDERTPDGVVQNLAQNARQPEGDWSRTRSDDRDGGE
ncbi:MAG TPA: hypothetical protein VK988_03440 [Acidimicrobiales bacterium]|nr:hypothetical protein [Acidimicrobiales bacterium]